MVEPKHTIAELQQMQALPLKAKIGLSIQRIRDWYEYNEGNVFVSFSGGKDSTALLHLVRSIYPEVKGLFIDTGLEYPEVRKFALATENVDVVRPKHTFKEVIHKYGIPFPSKEVAEAVRGAKLYVDKCIKDGLSTERERERERESLRPDNGRQFDYSYRRLRGIGEYDKGSNRNYLELAKEIEAQANGEWTHQRLKMMVGTLTTDGRAMKGKRSSYNMERWNYLMDAPFLVASNCCNVMKKSPSHQYVKETGAKPIIGTMATESKIRTQKWLQQGCNIYQGNKMSSKPLSFWTEQDVLLYLYLNKIPFAEVYGDIVSDKPLPDDAESRWLFDPDMPVLSTTGVQRTGCMFCLFGVHLEKEPNRLMLMKETHPHQYKYLMKPESEGGLGYKEKIDWINAHDKRFHINY